MLVTLQQARDHLRSDTDDDNDDLILKISAASESIIDYLGDYASSFIDGNGNIDLDKVPDRVKHATLLTIGYFYSERDGSQEFSVADQYGYGYSLPLSATALLYSLRKPTVL
jgi:hypothetical protein